VIDMQNRIITTVVLVAVGLVGTSSAFVNECPDRTNSMSDERSHWIWWYNIWSCQCLHKRIYNKC
jgi:hypothetical protein